MSVRRLVAATTTVLALSACSGEAAQPAGVTPSPRGSTASEAEEPTEPTASVRPVDQAPAPPDGWRVETWHYLTLHVPDGFGYGATSQWCIAEPRHLPRVMRPLDVHTLVRCDPGMGYGVSFLPADVIDPGVPSGRVWRSRDGDEYPAGSFVATVVEGRLAVQIVTSQRSVTEQIARSVRRTDVDGTGCRTHVVPPLLAARQDQPPVGTLCRYAVSGWLERSERLSPDDLAAAREAFVAAPDHPGHDHCIPPRGWVVVLRLAPDEIAEVQFGTVCGDGVSFLAVPEGPSGEDYGGLTAHVMHWALSPGWAQIMRRPVPWPTGNFR